MICHWVATKILIFIFQYAYRTISVSIHWNFKALLYVVYTLKHYTDKLKTNDYLSMIMLMIFMTIIMFILIILDLHDLSTFILDLS